MRLFCVVRIQHIAFSVENNTDSLAELDASRLLNLFQGPELRIMYVETVVLTHSYQC